MWSEPSLSLISGWGATLGLCSMLNSSFQLTILFATTSNKYNQITCLCQANSFSSSRKSCLMLLLMCKEEKTKVSKTTFLHNELYLANPIPPLCALKSKKVHTTKYNLFQISGFCYDGAKFFLLPQQSKVKSRFQNNPLQCWRVIISLKNIDF